ncbi:hypothetical protein [Sorangium sp. So ce426]|uniref:hypothetical protein n=1 Tax=Sorangium sp. So ce426 TaxID=3133312 RepID=UPI003F5B8D5E
MAPFASPRVQIGAERQVGLDPPWQARITTHVAKVRARIEPGVVVAGRACGAQKAL